KGLIAGSFSLGVATLLGAHLSLAPPLFLALLLGALSYGISLVLFIKALEGLGSSRTATFFSLGPFIGAGVAVLFLNDPLSPQFLAAAALMAIGVHALMAERHGHRHRHERLVHTHAHGHDMHHRHGHDGEGKHAHEHVHEPVVHSHVHWPDQHHRHEHDR
ncbi:MAG TPA: DMT family transporter, partial [Methanomassiliicoccaceae archaeon]|nr:DMT family transporter [Methanomassiliicoccaceae archaeon]